MTLPAPEIRGGRHRLGPATGVFLLSFFAALVAFETVDLSPAERLERAGFTVPPFERVRDVWPLAIIPYLFGLALARSRYR